MNSSVVQQMLRSSTEVADVPRELFAAYVALWSAATSRYPIGTNIYDREWDLLVVLDACRTDALRAVAPEYDFLSTVDTLWSVGSTSKEWVDRTFTHDYHEAIAETACITSNPFANDLHSDGRDHLEYEPINGTAIAESPRWNRLVADRRCSSDDFALFDRAWGIGDTRGTIRGVETNIPLPGPLTDRAIAAGRETDADRLLVHYMQPHAPYLSEAVEQGYIEEWKKHPSAAIQNDEISLSEAKHGYLDNLRYVLDHVEKLLENVDAERAVITADHGELFGEWNLYGHIVGVLHPAVRRVPWAKTAAVDTRSCEPSISVTATEERPDEVPVEHLEALGYR